MVDGQPDGRRRDVATERYSLRAVAPDLYAAMAALDRAAAQAVQGSLPRSVLELVKLRASQLNGCAYCLDMHGKDALALGVPTEKLFVLEAWREAPFYTEQERAALAWTEALTLIADSGVPDDVYEEVRAQFSEQELAALTMAIVAINGWNRIAISTRMEPGHYRSRLTPESAT
jgi:AhpD family alkylhydroperoxidase